METTSVKNSGGKKSEGKKHSITGILVSKLDEEAMDRAAKRLKVQDYEGDVVQKHVTLFGFFDELEKAGKTDMALCDTCGATIIHGKEECSFCGAKDEEDDDAPPAAGTEITIPSALAGAASSMVPVNQKLTQVKLAGAGKVRTEKDLDAAIAEIHALKGTAAGSFWDLGRKLAEVRDGQLWKLRPGEQGQPQKYKNFESLCKAELGMLPHNALGLMDGSLRYTREESVRMGAKKMTILARADDSVRAELEKDAAAGATTRQLVAKKKALTAGKPVVERSGKVRRPPVATKPKKSGDTITATALLDAPITIKLFKKPAKLSMLADEKDLARAKKLGDHPAGRFELPNGICGYVVIDAAPSGEWRARISFAREKDVE
jgi:hypothetical protein